MAVAPFAVNAPPDDDLPDVATLLADRIGTRGVARIIGPAELEAKPVTEPGSGRVVAWAVAARVDAVVVGRVTRIGGRLSIDARLHDGTSGAALGTYIAEVSRPEDLGKAVDQLAGQLVTAAMPLAGSRRTPAVAAAGAAKPPPGDSGASRAIAPAGAAVASTTPPAGAALAVAPVQTARAPAVIPATPAPTRATVTLFDRNKPISIRADELEADTGDGSRRFVFRKNVRVEHDNVVMHSQQLDAFYPPNTSQPDRLEATGAVRLRQGDRRASCDRASYSRAKAMVICRGNARLQDCRDIVKGDRIEFDLQSETVNVTGNVEILLEPGEDGEGCPE
jgi:lipopolysaccharide transport protein LptA